MLTEGSDDGLGVMTISEGLSLDTSMLTLSPMARTDYLTVFGESMEGNLSAMS